MRKVHPMARFRWLGCALVASMGLACSAEDPGLPVKLPSLQGGSTTIFDTSPNAFGFPARNLSSDHRDAFELGQHFFRRSWIAAPASAEGNDGLGPTYNAVSCEACHTRDGRGATPKEGENFVGVLLRLSIPGSGEHGSPLGDPAYGEQLNPYGISGVDGEGTPRVTYTEVPGAFASGETYSLRRPTFTIENLKYGPLASNVRVSPRLAPGMVGLGLLEAVDDASLEASADPNDANQDGISGRVNHVWDAVAGRARPGRFGLKANQPTIRQQTAGAFLGDIGITSSLFPKENCSSAQQACLGAPSGGQNQGPELSAQKLDAVTVYSLAIGVPAARNVDDPAALRGARLFDGLGCAACHRMTLNTGVLAEFPEFSNQVIHPYTDLLLHDMGPQLADGRPDFEATGEEWRTTPLWGLGLVPVVTQEPRYLHDGRARTVEEAILWHDGEAKGAMERYRKLSKADRSDLLFFLGTL